MPAKIDISTLDGLDEFATVRQLEMLDAVRKAGSISGGAVLLKADQSGLVRSLQRLRAAAAARGYSPAHDMHKTVPENFLVKGVSTYYGDDGKPRGQWVKSSLDDQKRMRAIRDAAAAMAEDLPRLAAKKAPAKSLDDLATVYTLTDSHVGMLAWGKETGADWDLKIAERVLTGCLQRMVDQSPASAVAIVNQLGDFLHSDGLTAVTPTSGHILDQDGRFEKLVAVAIRILRRVIDMALAKHRRVVVVMAEGNHDMASSVWLRVMFKALYENEPRVEVLDQPLPYYVYQHGQTLLGFHHGHLKKNDQLPLLFASQFPKIWGATVQRYVHTGHRHHVEEKEHSGMTVVQHPTLASRDAYAARGGWIAARKASAITYHAEFGEYSRVTVYPEV